MDQIQSYVTYSNWLIVVAAMRLLAVVLGYTYPTPVFGQNLETQLFDIANGNGKNSSMKDSTGSNGNSGSRKSSSSRSSSSKLSPTETSSSSPSVATSTVAFTPLAGRTFSVWTAVTCVVCLITASDAENKSLLKVTLGTFLIALGYFFGELFIYKTVSLRTAIRPAIIASISTVWTYYQLTQSK